MKLNWIKRIIKFPFCLVFWPVWMVAGFLLTDWEDKEDVDFFKRSINIFK